MRKTNLYLDPEKLRALELLAVTEDASVSDLVREAIDAIIDKRLRQNGAATDSAVQAATTTLLADALRRIDVDRSPDMSQTEIDHVAGSSLF